MTVEVGVNRRAGTGQSVTAAVFIVIAAGSIAVIPLLAANLDRRALGLAACVLTLVFWVGFIGAICCVGEIVNTPTRAFLLTSDWQLYYDCRFPLASYVTVLPPNSTPSRFAKEYTCEFAATSPDKFHSISFANSGSLAIFFKQS